ncbi:MAG: TIM barrel protein [Ruminococcaceae bacterium]|nr:TIM barrel protein [Oscillospiraceae bacterium]
MLKIGVADYGMSVWYGGLYDYEQRLDDLKAIGYDGLERLPAASADSAMQKLVALAERRMDFATCETNNIELNIKWTAALRKEYIWANKPAYIKDDFDAYCRTTRHLCQACARYGIRASVHNHLGSLVETQEQLEEYLARCPEVGLIFDTGHLGVAGGDLLHIVEKYYDRITAVHLKGWYSTDSSAKDWWAQGYFCGLGQGNTEIDNEGVVKALVGKGYDKWLFIEHDTHKQDPLLDLGESRKLLAGWLAE